jgi:hypothetical protein
MSVVLQDDIIVLKDPCRVEDAEPLLRFLENGPARRVDLGGVKHLHAAVFQVLLAFRPPIAGESGDPFVKRFLEPLLTAKETLRNR